MLNLNFSAGTDLHNVLPCGPPAWSRTAAQLPHLPLDPEPRQGSFLAIGLIEFDDSSVNFTKNARACRSRADTRVSAWKMHFHAETYLHAETVHGSTLKLSHFVSFLDEKFHAELRCHSSPTLILFLANSTLILSFSMEPTFHAETDAPR